uniref:WH2 domain-containing protein n=1 Tax=Mesocestoides corti TaxID=53468 RepID=A0A5K3FAA9_MESCO
MRDKRRLTHAEAVSEKLLGEKIASEEGENGVERLPRPPPKPPVTAGQPVPPPMRQILPIIPKTKPHDIPSPETGAAKTPITRIHVPPSVPPRAVRDLRANGSGVRLNSPELNNNTNTSTTTSGDTPSPAKSPSESSASPSSYVRPMQRNSNGHMVPVVDVLPKCPSERPPPPTRDHRSRTPKRPYSSQASYAAPPNPLLRQGPLPVTSPAEEHRPPRPGSPFLSTDTLNYGSQRRPFSCCHTM